MSKHAAVDFETTFFPKRKISLKNLGVDQYLWHPEVEVYMVSIYTADGSYVGHPREFDWGQIAHLDWVSHNAAFDRRVFRRLSFDDPSIRRYHPKNWYCTANLVAWMGCKRDLKSSCRELFNVDVDKDARKAMENKTVRELMNGPHWREICEYAERDAYWCWRLWDEFSVSWPTVERKISEMTTQQCLRGLPADQEYIQEAIQRLDRCCFDAKKQLPWANGTSDEKKVLSLIAVAEECRKLGIKPPRSTAEDSDDCQQWEAEHPEIPWVRSMRRYRKANLLKTKFEKMLSRIRPFDGRIDFSQKYCGAHTKRMTGDSGFNVHGFQRDPFACVELEAGQSVKSLDPRLVVDMRRAICAPEDQQIVVADLSQIEPRTLAWIVNDRVKLDLINRGISVYQVHAIQTLGWDELEDLKKKDPKLYQMCKMRVLGLSYGCGAPKFVSYCWNQYGYRMTLAESKKQVRDFRRKEKLVTRLWERLQTKLEASVGDDLHIELPSWNTQVYRDVRSVKGATRMEYTASIAGGRRNRLWGSLLCENIIQATARDCFYEKVTMLEDGGLPTLLPVHDEIVSDAIPARDAKEAREFVREVMRAECEWMPGVALDSECFTTPYYVK